MTCSTFYMIALPFIVLASIAGIISAYSSYRNYRIQSKWYDDYTNDMGPISKDSILAYWNTRQKELT